MTIERWLLALTAASVLWGCKANEPAGENLAASIPACGGAQVLSGKPGSWTCLKLTDEAVKAADTTTNVAPSAKLADSVENTGFADGGVYSGTLAAGWPQIVGSAQPVDAGSYALLIENGSVTRDSNPVYGLAHVWYLLDAGVAATQSGPAEFLSESYVAQVPGKLKVRTFGELTADARLPNITDCMIITTVIGPDRVAQTASSHVPGFANGAGVAGTSHFFSEHVFPVDAGIYTVSVEIGLGGGSGSMCSIPSTSVNDPPTLVLEGT